MAENRGIAPPDMSTSVGQVRAMLGDMEYAEYDPVEPSFGMYALMGDAEIEAFLAQSEDSVEGATYFAYLSMAGAAALESKSVKDFDLQVDLTKRAGDLRLIAAAWKERWDSQTADIFEVFDIGTSAGRVPELAPLPAVRW